MRQNYLIKDDEAILSISTKTIIREYLFNILTLLWENERDFNYSFFVDVHFALFNILLANY